MFEFIKKAFGSFAANLSKPTEKKIKEKIEKPRTEEIKEIQKSEKRSLSEKIVSAITEVKVSEEQFDKIFNILEIELIQNNVAFPVIQQLRSNLEKELLGKNVPRTKLELSIREVVKKTLLDILNKSQYLNLLDVAKYKKEKNEPLILLLVGVNGHGKTLTIAKLAKLFQNNSFIPVFAAADTFRAAAIEQLKEHAEKLNVRLISHNYGSDPAAVAFDAIKAKNKDVVLIDTAGRQSLDENLMAELLKIKRVAKPDFTIFVGEAIAGADLVSQAKLFNEKIGIDGIILTKADVDDKGGALLSLAYALQKPILYLGTGQSYDDLTLFDSKMIVNKMLD
ncbi:MAG: signal recognition particle-docking protein FtsY [Candidatus Nanoarchaeia archaeon]